MAKDIFPQQVKAALIKSGWTDPYIVRITDVIKLQIDLGAENAIELVIYEANRAEIREWIN
jgi:XisH protein